MPGRAVLAVLHKAGTVLVLKRQYLLLRPRLQAAVVVLVHRSGMRPRVLAELRRGRGQLGRLVLLRTPHAVGAELDELSAAADLVDTYVAILQSRANMELVISRSGVDYNYEETIACANKLIAPELETIYLRAENAAISSSIVEEMFHYGKDISGLVPGPVYRLLLSLREKEAEE